MKKMIYNYKTHSINYDEKVDNGLFSLTIGMLELLFELQTGKIIGLQGFLPLVKASKFNINLPNWKEGTYLLKNIDLSIFEPSMIYNLKDKAPKISKYFENKLVKFDENKGIIQIGSDMGEDENGVKVNNNIFCGFDYDKNLKCIYIIPDIFI